MPSKLFASQEDFRGRVIETIVTYDGLPFYANPHPSNQFHLRLGEFPSGTMVHDSVHVDDDRLFIGALRLGLFNDRGFVYQCDRTPARRYRYGTPPEHIHTESVSDSSGRSVEVYNQGFYDMLINRYPTVTEAINSIKASGGKSAFAVSRSFFLKENNLGLLQLHFRDKGPVLWMAPDGTITFVEKTSLNQYLPKCSKQLTNITQELRNHAL